MAIHFVVGRPGAGKGLCCMTETNREIIGADRCVLTNFAIEKNAWVNGKHQPMLGYSAYLYREHKKTFDMEDRIFRVSDEAAGEFFLYRALSSDITECAGATLVIPDDGVMTLEEMSRHKKWRLWRADAVTRERDGAKQIMEYNTNLYSQSGGMLVVIDEAWKFWGSRNWQTTGNGVIFYGKQHRKVADDFLLCTQSPKDIDAAIVRIAQDFWVCRNRGLLRLGMFRQQDDFKVAVYEHAPTGGASQTPMNTFTFKLDKLGLAQCYDTTAGVGLSGRMAGDIGKKKRGLNFKWIIVAMCLMPILIFFLFSKLLNFGARKTIGAFVPSAQHGSNFLSQATSAGRGYVPGFGSSTPAPVVEKTEPLEKPEPVFCVGYILGKYPIVYLSDGRTAEAEFGEVQGISRRMVFCFGEKFPMVLKPRGGDLPEQPIFHRDEILQSPVLPVSSASPVFSGNSVQVTGGISGQGGLGPPILNGMAGMRGGRF